MNKPTFAEQVIDFFDRNPTEEMLIEDAAIKFGVTNKLAQTRLLRLEEQGLLSSRYEREEGGATGAPLKVYSLNSRHQEAA